MGPTNKSWSSAAVVRGAWDVPLGLVGAGAENRIVGPIVPVGIDGGAYIALDFAQEPVPFPIRRTGLARLYNQAVPLDYRHLVAFGRDISALSPAEYDALPRPRRVTRFPDDLVQATGLEFSGIYEDAWVSPAADFVLGAANPGEAVRIAGFVPALPGVLNQAAGRMTVAVNGEPALTVPAAPGPFDWIVPIDRPGPRTRLAIRFSTPGKLPAPDDRPVAAKLASLEIGPVPPAFTFGGADTGMFPATGVDSDGWVKMEADLAVPVPPGAETLSLRLDYPGWVGVPPESAVAISADGGPPVRWVLKPGSNLLTVALRPGPLLRRLHLAAEQRFQMPAPDGRIRAYRILSVSGLPASAP
jgi:hypothetical protein